MLETWDWNQVSNSLAACFLYRRAFFGRHIKTMWFDSTATWLMVVGIEKMLNIQKKTPVSTHSTWWTWHNLTKGLHCRKWDIRTPGWTRSLSQIFDVCPFFRKPDFGVAPPGGPVMTLTRSFEQRYPQFFPQNPLQRCLLSGPQSWRRRHGPYQWCWYRWYPYHHWIDGFFWDFFLDFCKMKRFC